MLSWCLAVEDKTPFQREPLDEAFDRLVNGPAFDNDAVPRSRRMSMKRWPDPACLISDKRIRNAFTYT